MTNEFDRNCGRVASELTAYFDGQATPAEVRRARAHLESCGNCAELWLSWQQARALLSSETVSTPPHLAQRILMACRLDALGRTGAPRVSRSQARALPPEVVALRLDLQSFDNFRPEETVPEPPAYLLDAILSRTTRSGEPMTEDKAAPEEWHLQTALFQDAPLTPLVHERGFSPVGTLRRTFAFAVPALFLWMMWPGGLAPEGADRGVLSSGTVALQVETPSFFASRTDAPKAAPGLKPMARRNAQPAADSAAAPASEADVTVRSEEHPAEVRFAAGPRRSEAVAREAVARPAVARMSSLPSNEVAQPDDGISVPMPRASFRSHTATPRMLTTVSFAPVALRSDSVASRTVRAEAPRPAVAEARPAVEAESSEDSSLDGRFLATSAIDTYRAALAEDVDEVESEG